MTIENSIQRWQAYSHMFQKLVDTFGNDIENDNVVSPIEAVFMCNLHALLFSALCISDHALRIAKATQNDLQKGDENNNGIREDN